KQDPADGVADPGLRGFAGELGPQGVPVLVQGADEAAVLVADVEQGRADRDGEDRGQENDELDRARAAVGQGERNDRDEGSDGGGDQGGGAVTPRPGGWRGAVVLVEDDGIDRHGQACAPGG